MQQTKHTLTTLPEMAELLPPLSEEQLATLEQDILANGCYSPIIVNEDNIIVDGHNRHSICEKHNLPYDVRVMKFQDLLEAKQWALNVQKSRRNLSSWEIGQIILKLKPDLESRAKQKEQERKTTFQKSEKSGLLQYNTTGQLAEMADVSTDTMNKIIKIDKNAPDNIKQALDNKDISINKGYEFTKHLKDIPESEREELAQILLEHDKKNDKVDKSVAVAKLYCQSFEKGNLITVDEDNIRSWIDYAGIRSEMTALKAENARDIAAKFILLAEILENVIIPNDIRRQK